MDFFVLSSASAAIFPFGHWYSCRRFIMWVEPWWTRGVDRFRISKGRQWMAWW